MSRSGTHKRFVAVGQVPTNCAFDGSDLIVTDGGDLGLSGEPVLAGRLLRVTGIGARGLRLFRGSLG